MSSFARTKIQPPRPRALIERPALEARLGDALLTHRLVLLTAAAGFGKTSALARQIERLPPGTAVAWVSCDEGDLPLQLFACLVAALDPFDAPWRTAPDALIARAAAAPDTPEGRAGPMRAVINELINALDACDAPRGVIMVDDLHRITHPGVFEFLDRLLERLSPRWTMAIASREAPPIALARLRAAGELAEFSLDALRFNEDESTRMARAAGLPADTAQALHARTAGWPAGLRLALSVLASMSGASLEGSAPVIDRRVFEFLAAEVLNRLDPELREFLLRTSVLPELTASRSAALTGDARAAERLEAIERAGLFVSVLAEAEPTLRLHDLFRDALESRLQRERPALWRELLQRAAATEPDPLRRVGALMRAEAWREAEAALVDVGESLIVDGDTAVVESLLARFPAAQRAASGGLLFLAAKLAWTRWDWAAMLARATAAAEAFARSGDGPGQARALSYRALAMASVGPMDEARALATELLAAPELQDIVAARALMALCWIEFSHGDQRAIAPMWRRLTHHLERTSDVVGWYECTPIPSYANLAGMRAPLLRHVQAARRRWPERPSPARGMCTVIEGLLHLWAGDIAAAEACAALAAEDARWLARPPNLEAFVTLLPALLAAVQGRSSEAQAPLQRLIDEVMQSGDAARIALYRGVYLYAALRCAAAADDTPVMTRRAAELQAAVSAAPPDALPAGLARQYATAARAYAALAAGDDESACREWQDIIEREHECDHYAQVPDARLRLADARLRASRPLAEAAALLAPLFERIAASGERGLPRMAGAATLARLAAVNWQGHLPADALPALRRWAATDAAPSPAAAAAPPPTVAGGLSSREAEVLARIAAGDSNKLIAREFDLSPHTVKRHVANILDKLALRSRGQAAAWYHEHHG
jgi:LuxR family transcriptional regulator, maltose regulon positive regulatory protein